MLIRKEIHLDEDAGSDKYNRYRLLVTSYRTEPYEGSGVAYGLRDSEDVVDELSLGHCSCNGPWSNDAKPTSWPVAQFKEIVFSADVTIGTVIDLPVAQRFVQELKEVR